MKKEKTVRSVKRAADLLAVEHRKLLDARKAAREWQQALGRVRNQRDILSASNENANLLRKESDRLRGQLRTVHELGECAKHARDSGVYPASVLNGLLFALETFIAIT